MSKWETTTMTVDRNAPRYFRCCVPTYDPAEQVVICKMTEVEMLEWAEERNYDFKALGVIGDVFGDLGLLLPTPPASDTPND